LSSIEGKNQRKNHMERPHLKNIEKVIKYEGTCKMKRKAGKTSGKWL